MSENFLPPPLKTDVNSLSRPSALDQFNTEIKPHTEIKPPKIAAGFLEPFSKQTSAEKKIEEKAAESHRDRAV